MSFNLFDTAALLPANEGHRMLRRRLQSASGGGASGTLFSALMLVIIVVCFIAYCYRRSIYNLHHRAAADVEVITETNAQLTDAEVNFAEVGACPPENTELDSANSSKKHYNESLNVEKVVPKKEEVAIAYEYDVPRVLAGTVQARPIRVMESFRNVAQESAPSGGRFNNNGSQSPSTQRAATPPSTFLGDHDYLIETERNTFEFNSDFNRVASANELFIRLLEERNRSSTAPAVEPTSTSTVIDPNEFSMIPPPSGSVSTVQVPSEESQSQPQRPSPLQQLNQETQTQTQTEASIEVTSGPLSRQGPGPVPVVPHHFISVPVVSLRQPIISNSNRRTRR